MKGFTISQKLYFVVGAMAVLVAIELIALAFCVHTLSAVRAIVGAEGLWSKGQKEAVYYLQKYRFSGDEADYKKFRHFMDIPLGDHVARMGLLKEKIDYDSVKTGFIRGHIHKDDINGIIDLYKRFGSTYYISKAFSIWSEGDTTLLPKIIAFAESLHNEMKSGHPSKEKLDLLMQKIDPVNAELSKLEDAFSYTLGEGSRWLEGVILKLLFSIALCVEISGFIMTIYLKKDISKGLNEINSVAKEISRGDYSRRAVVFSNDEIGGVAHAINQMTEDLLSKSAILRQNEERLQLVLKATQLGIWEMNLENNTIWRNLKNDQIFGYTELQEDWSWRKFLAHVLKEDRRKVWEEFKKAHENGLYSIECRIKRKNKVVLWLYIEGKAYKNVKGRVVKMAGIVMDISRRKANEEKLIQSNKELEQFAFAASHDLQEPLRSISNFTDLLQQQSHVWEDKEANVALGYILRASERMKKLVKDLLEYSRIGTDFTVEYVDCNVVLSEVLNGLSDMIHQKAALITYDPLPVLNACPIKLKMLFKNLITNAIIYSRKGIHPKLHIGIMAKDHDWLFQFTDNGIGIENKYFERIFVVFQKLHSKNEYPGSGIGLAIGKKIVELHGGKLWVASEYNKGSTFYFTLPKALTI